MTETAILPGLAGNDTVAPTGEGDEQDGGNRRRLMMLGAAGGVVVVAVAGYFLLHKGSSDTTPTLTAVHHGGLPVGATHTGKAGSKSGHPASGSHGGVTLPKTTKHVNAGRDPFRPLVIAPVTGGTSAGTTTVAANPTSTTAPTGTTTTGTTPVTVTPPTTSPSNGGAPTSNGTTGSPTYVQLVKTDGEKVAVFRVGYAHHRFRTFRVHAPKVTSQRGTVFDAEFALIGIQNGEVTLQVGDATPFDLPEGVARAL